MSELEKCLSELREAYPDIEIQPCSCGDDVIGQLPPPLREYYRLYGAADFPFGHIYSAEVALNDPIAKQAFGDEWLEFGCDDYGSFWLCRFAPDEDGTWLTAWDHDLEEDGPEAVCADLSQFLRDREEEY